MRVLIACEYSGIIRDAFKARGHDAWSCDLLPTERPGQHYQGDIRDMLSQHWDLMVGHPPCTHILNSGCKWLYKGGQRWERDENGKKTGRENPRNLKRWRDMVSGAEFFKLLWNAPIKKICLENPIMVGYAKEIIGVEQSQTIQPWQFGHGEIKATCLWLKNLPLLKPTAIVEGREPRVHYASPGPDRWKERSRSYPGIGEAMAQQWG